MQITQEMLQQRLALLNAERAQAVSAVASYDGALAQLQWEIAQLATEPPVAPEEPKAKRSAPKCKGRGCNKRLASQAEVTHEIEIATAEAAASVQDAQVAGEEQANG